MFKIILLAVFLLSLLGCSALPGANPTPVIIVVTATPDATRGPVVTFFTATPPAVPQSTSNPTGTVDPNATPAPIDTATLNLKATDVKYVLAKQDINIRKGPGTNFDIVGGVFAGNTAEVTGYKSADDLWWRVVCPVDGVTDCWVSADSALTEPTTPAGATPTGTTEASVIDESVLQKVVDKIKLGSRDENANLRKALRIRISISQDSRRFAFPGVNQN